MYRGSVEAARGEGDHRLDLVAVEPIEPLEEVVDAGTRLNVLEDGGDRHAGTLQDPGTAQFTGHAFYRGTLRPIETGHFGETPFRWRSAIILGLTFTRIPASQCDGEMPEWTNRVVQDGSRRTSPGAASIVSPGGQGMGGGCRIPPLRNLKAVRL
jgi:hypothetical protein